MATVTVRNLPKDLVERIKTAAANHRRSMEEELRELFAERYPKRSEVLRRIRESWEVLPEVPVEKVNEWLREARSRDRKFPHGS